MGFLILDTDKQSTSSLRTQLDTLGELGVREVADPSAFARMRARRLPPPDVIFLDQDGDPERVEAFRSEIEFAGPSSVVVFFGTDQRSGFLRSHDTYVRKPIFTRKLERTVLGSYARGQERRHGVGYLGGGVPAGLIREFSHVSDFWKQILPVESASLEDASSLFLAKMGALFIVPLGSQPMQKDHLEIVRRLQRFTSASRILLIGVGNVPEQTRDLRRLADYFIPENPDWKEVLTALAARRFQRLESELGLRRSRAFASSGKISSCKRELRRILRKDPWNLTVHGRLADLAFSSADYKSAETGYRRILELNPCQPRAYLRLLEIEKRTLGAHMQETLARARAYCPKVPAVQMYGEGTGPG